MNSVCDGYEVCGADATITNTTNANTNAPGASSGARLAELEIAALRRRLKTAARSGLAKACGAVRGLRVHDAMAGWGTDGLLLAGLGCIVHMSECEPALYQTLRVRIAALAARRVKLGPVTAACEDAQHRWSVERFDVIYLDPMFAAHPKSAAPAKRMRALAAMARPTAVAALDALLADAMRAAKDRVVLKRRVGAPVLGEPGWSIRGASVRFDVYPRRRPARRAVSVGAAPCR